MPLRMRFFRHRPGDLGLADEPILGEIVPSTAMLKARLFAHHMMPHDDGMRALRGETVTSGGEVLDWAETHEALV